MVLCNVTYTVKPGLRQEFYEKIEEKAKVFRKERGCIQYEYFFSVARPDVFVLIEQWEDDECLQAHCSTELFDSLQAIKGDYLVDVTKAEFRV